MLLGIILFCSVIFVDARVVEFRNDQRSVCLTEECEEFARVILTNMNASVDPCMDFYEYACGNWPRTDSLAAAGKFGRMRAASDSENKRKVNEMLKLELRGDEIPPVKIAKQWYKVCMNKEDMNERGMRPLVSILNEIGGWPITMQRNARCKQKWQNIDDYYAHLRGFNLLHDVRVTTYGRNSKELTAVLDVPDMPPYSWLLDKFFDGDSSETDDHEKRLKDMKRYRNFISKIVSKIVEDGGLNATWDQIEEDISDILIFQWKLSKITSLVDDYVNTTVKDFQTWYNNLRPLTERSAINWTDKIIGVFKEAGIDIPENTVLKVASPGYIRKLIPLLDETSSITIVNYLHWSFVSSMITRTTDEMRELHEKMVDWDTVVREDRSDLCIEEAKIQDVIAYEYSRRYFSNDAVNKTLDVLDDMRREVEIDIEKSNWANETIKELALRRIRLMKKKIGYPDWYNNSTIMENYFGQLTMGPSYFENALKFLKYYKLKELRLLKYNDVAKSWLINPLTINAFYLTEPNSIIVPLANLQKPFFSKNQPNTVNYALTGYLLAHEMYHPFDELRHRYDENGKTITWSEAMSKRYYESARCFIEQYDNYTLSTTPSGPKIMNYGNLTFDENMPDTMGLKTAFRAYKRRERIIGKPESALPGLEMFDNDQTFFLSSANLWCRDENFESTVTEAKLDVHSIARLRSIGALSNNQDFANTFSCPLGSPMNPQKKCNIWKI
ncbi:PREDICTED: membrane metallo-endopeptidase-like 1 [Eufriesea mexicana]|uniref:membrane metallo-endopeptidase-like 1 n=1 Tax=Eufriesea mexicana TaxID=516756 RepID=UPI00083C1C31|nr:PREDICTED: membrane metallo-endopeptidase-like 1 [Eufriesea mexicana]